MLNATAATQRSPEPRPVVSILRGNGASNADTSEKLAQGKYHDHVTQIDFVVDMEEHDAGFKVSEGNADVGNDMGNDPQPTLPAASTVLTVHKGKQLKSAFRTPGTRSNAQEKAYAQIRAAAKTNPNGKTKTKAIDDTTLVRFKGTTPLSPRPGQAAKDQEHIPLAEKRKLSQSAWKKESSERQSSISKKSEQQAKSLARKSGFYEDATTEAEEEAEFEGQYLGRSTLGDLSTGGMKMAEDPPDAEDKAHAALAQTVKYKNLKFAQPKPKEAKEGAQLKLPSPEEIKAQRAKFAREKDERDTARSRRSQKEAIRAKAKAQAWLEDADKDPFLQGLKKMAKQVPRVPAASSVRVKGMQQQLDNSADAAQNNVNWPTLGSLGGGAVLSAGIVMTVAGIAGRVANPSTMVPVGLATGAVGLCITVGFCVLEKRLLALTASGPVPTDA